ncbi:MAG: hypothetical protein AAF598_22395, partial [Bacteroidota bacterium]
MNAKSLRGLIALCFSISFQACHSLPEFVYEGEHPPVSVLCMENFILEEIAIDDQKQLEDRNRIYFELDSLRQVRLNGVKCSVEEMPFFFEYVYTNPEGLAHLPIAPSEAVIVIQYEQAANSVKQSNSARQNQAFLKIDVMYDQIYQEVVRLRRTYAKNSYQQTLEA